MKLNNRSLFRGDAFIDGEWVSAKQRFAVTNPATGEEIGSVAALGAEETSIAISAAHRAFAQWRNKTAKERAQILKRWFALVMQNAEDLARIMTCEQGKPLAESRNEVRYAA
jgi:succinate-semialdehyde dehydrogenase/glutarate-semialdehyde dehydrogenase